MRETGFLVSAFWISAFCFHFWIPGVCFYSRIPGFWILNTYPPNPQEQRQARNAAPSTGSDLADTKVASLTITPLNLIGKEF